MSSACSGARLPTLQRLCWRLAAVDRTVSSFSFRRAISTTCEKIYLIRCEKRMNLFSNPDVGRIESEISTSFLTNTEKHHSFEPQKALELLSNTQTCSLLSTTSLSAAYAILASFAPSSSVT